MAVLNQVSFEDAVDLVNREFNRKLESIPGTMRESGFVTITSIPSGTGNTRRHKEKPHANEYASMKTESGNVHLTTVQQGYYKDTTAVTYDKAVTISLEMRTYDKTDEYRNAVDFITGVYQNREDLNLSAFLSFGTATTYVDQDGNTVDISTGSAQSLWNTAHTLTGSTTTYRNRLANNPQFSEGALENMEDLARTEIYNNLGEQMTVEFDILWTTDKPQLVNSVRRLLQATAQVSAPNAGVPNVYRAKYDHKILRRSDMNAVGAKDSTKANYWGLASSKQSTFFHDVYMAPQMRMPAIGNNGEDPNTLDWQFTVVGAHASCVVVGRGLLFSSGDASA